MFTILPYRWCFIAGSTARHARNTPRRFTAMTRSHSSTVISSIVPRVIGMVAKIAALFTRMSMRPKRASADSAIAFVLASSATSARTLCPRAPSSEATVAAAASSTSATTTLAPAAARAREYAFPMPWPPPVTMATRPPRRSGMDAPGGADRHAQAAEPADRGLDHVAVVDLAHALRRPGEDDVARLEAHDARGVRDDAGHPDGEIARARVLLGLPTDREVDGERAGIGDLVGGGNPGPERRERVPALAPRPITGAAFGDVEPDRVAEDVR